MGDVVQNTLYLTTPGTFVSRDHLTIRIEIPVYSPDLPTEERSRENAIDWRKLSIPIHHLESVCSFGPQITLTAPLLDLCWEHGVSVNYLSENGYLQARVTGVADTSVSLRRAHFRSADIHQNCAALARQFIAGKIQNSRNSLLRSSRETDSTPEKLRITVVTDFLARQLHQLGNLSKADLLEEDCLATLRGFEGISALNYFSVFSLLLKQQKESFNFTSRSRRPPRDKINCFLSFTYALLRHDCVAALTAVGLDPFVGFLHAERPNRPALALDLMEEFRPWIADRLAITLINRRQIGPEHFRDREGGSCEFTDAGRRIVISAYQDRKRESLHHSMLNQSLRIGQLPFIQARILARYIRCDLPEYLPFIPK